MKMPTPRPARAPFKRTLTLALYAHLAFASLAQATALTEGSPQALAPAAASPATQIGG